MIPFLLGQIIVLSHFCFRTLSSETFAAGFGSALATIDANGDGRDDLLVSKALKTKYDLYES